MKSLRSNIHFHLNRVRLIFILPFKIIIKKELDGENVCNDFLGS